MKRGVDEEGWEERGLCENLVQLYGYPLPTPQLQMTLIINKGGSGVIRFGVG